jgi:hypothetical protein
MKRDMDLVREILLALEDGDTPLVPSQLPDRTPEEVSYHIHLLHEAGLIEGWTSKTLNSPLHAVANRLTWEGHDFLEAAKNDRVWKKAKKIAAEKGGGLTLEVLKQLLSKLLTELVLGKS